MKKIYFTPQSKEIAIHIESMVAISFNVADTEGESGEDLVKEDFDFDLIW